MLKCEVIDRHLQRLKKLLEDGYIHEDDYFAQSNIALEILARTTENASQIVREGELLDENGLVRPPDNAVECHPDTDKC